MKAIGEFFRILHEQTPAGDKAIIGTGGVISGSLMLSDWAAIVGILVGVVTIAATVQRMFIAHEELQARSRNRDSDTE